MLDREPAVRTATALVCLIGFCVQSLAAQDAPAKKSSRVSGPTVVGTIVLPDGTPAADATVYLLQSTGRYFSLPTKPRVTQTRADGTFELEETAAGDHRLWAETDSFTTLTKKLGGRGIRVEAESSTESTPIELKLHPGCGYDIAIHDAATEKPIAGAKISFGWTDIVREYVSGEDGVARPRNLGIDDWYFIVRADGYATEFLKTSKQELGTILPLRFDLQRGGTLIGTLRDGDGAPVTKAKVSIQSASRGMEPSYGSMDTDADGNFRFDGLPVGKQFRISASKEGYNPASNECVIASPDEPTRADFVAIKRPYGGDVRITVLDQNDQPIPAATLANQGNSSNDVRSGETNEQGVCLLQDLYTSYAGCQVTVKADGYIAMQTSVEPGTIDEPSQLTVHLRPGKTLRGVVVLPSGDPASKLDVYFNGGERGFGVLGGRVQTDAEGKFEIRGLAEMATLTVYVPQQYAPVRGMSVQVDGEEFEIRLQPAGVLIARAIDAKTKEPIASFNVKLGFCEDRRPGDPQTGGISTMLTQQGENILGTKKEFRLEGQTPGTPYKLIVSAEGYETQTVARAEAQPSDSAKAIDVPLRKIRAEDYQTVAGRLIDAEGEPIVGASVRLLVGAAVPQPSVNGRMLGWRFYHWGLLSRDDIENRDQCLQLLKTTSDAEGRFEFTGVKRDAPWVELFYFGNHLMPQRYSNMRSFTEVELADLVVQAEPPATLAIELDPNDWPSVDNVQLEAQNYFNGPNAVELAFASESQSIGDGPITFRNLPSGTYTLTLTAKPVPQGNGMFRVASIHQQSIKIEAGKEHELEWKK